MGLGKSGLSDEKLFSGGGERAAIHDLDKVSQDFNIHNSSSYSKNVIDEFEKIRYPL